MAGDSSWGNGRSSATRSLPFMGGPFEKPEASIHLDVLALEGLLDADTIFVSHSPALGILDSGIGDTHIGSSSLRDLLLRNPVRAHIHGHSHSDFGRQGSTLMSRPPIANVRCFWTWRQWNIRSFKDRRRKL